MLSNPKPNQRCRIRYRKGLRDHMPYHDRIATVVIPGRGKPRNHGVRIDDTLIAIHAGQLMMEK